MNRLWSKKIAALILLIILLSINGYCLRLYYKNQELVAGLKSQNEKLTAQLLGVQHSFYILRRDYLDNTPQLSEYRKREYARKGFTDPEKQIKAALHKRPDLIPIEAVLGGTMYFIESEMWFINDYTIIAGFEDGHIGGYAAITFQIADNKIEFTLIKAWQN